MSAITDAAPPASRRIGAITAAPGSADEQPAGPVETAEEPTDPVWEKGAARAGSRAARRARALPAIASAQFSIHGTPQAPALEASVGIRASADFAKTVDAVMERIVPDVEKALGHDVLRTEIDFFIAPALPSLTRPASPTTVLTIV